MTGLSPAQITRLIRTYLDTGKVQAGIYRRHPFVRNYTDADLALLAEGGGSRAGTTERIGNAADSGARVPRLRQTEIPTAGRNLRVPPVQSAAERPISPARCRVRGDAAEPGVDRLNTQATANPY